MCPHQLARATQFSLQAPPLMRGCREEPSGERLDPHSFIVVALIKTNQSPKRYCCHQGGVLQFQCDQCGWVQNSYKHLKTHSGPCMCRICLHCGYDFSQCSTKATASMTSGNKFSSVPADLRMASSACDTASLSERNAVVLDARLTFTQGGVGFHDGNAFNFIMVHN